MKNLCLLLCLGIAGLVCSAVFAEETHPFSVHDMLAMERIGDPNVSPDGKWIVFTLSETSLDANRSRTDLWLVGTDGQGLRRLTSNPAADFNPRWSVDGQKIWFLSARSGLSQVWRISVSGGEAVQITDFPVGVSNLVVNPKGKMVAFTAAVYPEEGCMTLTKKKLEQTAASKQTGRIYEQLYVRHWDRWKDGRRSHLFVWKCETKEAVNLMAGMDADTPGQPFGGPAEITFTPDGKGLIFTSKDAGREQAWSTDYNLYYVPVDGSARPVNLTAENKARDASPAFSPDGRTLAYQAMSRPGFEADKYNIILMDWATKEKRILTENWDRSPYSMTWAQDGKSIFVTAQNLGRRSVFRIDARSGNAVEIVPGGTVSAIPYAGREVIFAMNSLTSPVELYSVMPNGRNVKAITQINADKLNAARMGEAEQFTFKGWNDETVYCWVVKPVDFDPAKKYPVAFLIHGGPQGSFGDSFHYRWNPQAYAGAGYAAVMVDFHGSTGYGQDFTDAISNDWGGKPLVDLQKGLEAALDRYEWMDGENAAALGASYGGYMINWIAGSWPDRFKALVNHSGIINTKMFYYDTEELWFPEWEFNGTQYDNPAGYEKYNPINYVNNWKTPMLVIHGALDFRVVETQGMAAFTALQRRGIPSKFLYFPDENHWILKPHNSIQWHNTVIDWLDEWCK